MGNSMKSRQRGNTTFQTIGYLVAALAACGLILPYVLDILRSGQTDQAALELRQTITKIRSNHAFSNGNYAETGPEEFAAALSTIKQENKTFSAEGDGTKTRVTHSLGDSSKPLSLTPAMIVYSNDAARLTIPGLQESACKGLPMAVTALVDTLTINGTTVKSLNSTLSKELVEKIAEACHDGQANTLEVVFR